MLHTLGLIALAFDAVVITLAVIALLVIGVFIWQFERDQATRYRKWGDEQ